MSGGSRHGKRTFKQNVHVMSEGSRQGRNGYVMSGEPGYGIHAVKYNVNVMSGRSKYGNHYTHYVVFGF